VKEFTGDPLKIEIKDAAGKPVANLTAPGTPGFVRLTWNLKPTKELLTEYGGEGADKFVRPGEYEATLSYGTIKETQKFRVMADTRLETR
jgi:hypothetical protein